MVHRKDLDFAEPGEWEIVSINLSDLNPSIRGDPANVPALRKDLAVRLGIMLNDITDGPFRIEVDWVDLVKGDAEKPTEAARLTDFETDAGIKPWYIVNDGVMGGKSVGEASFDLSTMTFAGTINTDGGGFSSVRMNMDPGTLRGVKAIRFHAMPDGRDYTLLVEDNWGERRFRVSHRKPLAFGKAGAWNTVTVELDDLIPSFRGRRVDAEPLKKDLAVTLGITLNDGEDGPFELQIDWIDLVKE